jgi:hypothetical protein
MTLTIYLPPGAMTLQQFRDQHPAIIRLLDGSVDLVAGHWDEAPDVADRPPGIVLYNSICTHTTADVMAGVCEVNGHLCLYHNGLIFPDREPIDGDAMKEFVVQWLRQLQVTRPAG